ncbi:MAG: hypothetical protein JJU40_00515 [Rhodobacteraceae bacterium]|nr:hypothetical protein [Paracoccaceae bacterium]
MTTDPPRARRVLLLAGSFADARPAIGLAVALAARTQAALEAVLALDPRTEAAEGARLVTWGRPAGTTLLLSREGMSIAYAADARAFRSSLDRAALEMKLRASFRTDSGTLPDLALGLRQPGDAVIMACRRFLPLQGPVAALEDDEDGPAARLATELARMFGTRARVLPADTPPDVLDPMLLSALVLSRTNSSDPAHLAALIDAARCPALLTPVA